MGNLTRWEDQNRHPKRCWTRRQAGRQRSRIRETVGFHLDRLACGIDGGDRPIHFPRTVGLPLKDPQQLAAAAHGISARTRPATETIGAPFEGVISEDFDFFKVLDGLQNFEGVNLFNSLLQDLDIGATSTNCRTDRMDYSEI